MVLHEQDVDLLFAALRHLPEAVIRLKHGIGRKDLWNASEDGASLQTVPDEDRRIPEIEVVRTFIHYGGTGDTRSVRTL